MKAKIIAMVIVLAALGSISTGCRHEKNSNLIDILQIAPQDADLVVCIDVELLASDPDLEYLYSSLQDTLAYEMGGILSLDSSNACVFASIEGSHGYFIVIKGEFDLEEFRGTFEEQGIYPLEYGEAEVFTVEDESIAFLKGMIIFGYADYVMAPVRVSNDEEPSLYDDGDVKAVADRLPDGIHSVIYREDSIIYDVSALVCGLSVMNLTSGDELLDIQGCYKFGSEAEAEASMEDVEGHLKDMFDATQIDSQLKGEFIEATAKTYITD